MATWSGKCANYASIILYAQEHQLLQNYAIPRPTILTWILPQPIHALHSGLAQRTDNSEQMWSWIRIAAEKVLLPHNNGNALHSVNITVFELTEESVSQETEKLAEETEEELKGNVPIEVLSPKVTQKFSSKWYTGKKLVNPRWVTNKVTAPQDAHRRLMLQVYLGSNTSDRVQCYTQVRSLLVGLGNIVHC